MLDVPDIKLIRTDTTLDLSHLADFIIIIIVIIIIIIIIIIIVIITIISAYFVFPGNSHYYYWNCWMYLKLHLFLWTYYYRKKSDKEEI